MSKTLKREDEQLAPCNHCRSTTMREIHTVHKRNGEIMYHGRCACGNKTHPYMTYERAVEAWNRRYAKCKS